MVSWRASEKTIKPRIDVVMYLLTPAIMGCLLQNLFGVRDVFCFDDPDIELDSMTGSAFEASANYSILTLPRISDFYQHPMGVAVVADSEEICDRALRLLKIEWEERPFVLEMEEALKPDAPKIMMEVKRLRASAKEPNTVCVGDVEIGNVEKGFAGMSGITASAIYNAIGKWINDYPNTPDMVLKALGRI